MLKWEGPFFLGGFVKPWLSWADQLELWKRRGLVIDSDEEALRALASTNYYRLSGYARYHQVAPESGLNNFVQGTTFDQVWCLYQRDAELRQRLSPALADVEILLRTAYAYVVGQTQAGRDGSYLEESFFSGATTSQSMAAICLKDLDRCRERHVLRYKTTGSVRPYSALPPWSAVEAFSFGTLSKCIERSDHGRTVGQLAEQIGVAKAGLASRIKSLVYLRNRCAHHGRLWNHSVLDAGATPNNVRHRAKRVLGQFEHRSVVDIVVSLDDLLSKGRVRVGLMDEVATAFRHDAAFWRGLAHPINPVDGQSARR